MTIRLEGKNVQEFIIEDSRTQIDFVYLDYRKRVRQKNGAGRVIYFDLVMLGEESIKHLEDREEVFNEKNNFGLRETSNPKKKSQRKSSILPTIILGERVTDNQ